MTPVDWTKPPFVYQAFLGAFVVLAIIFILVSLVVKLLSRYFVTLRKRPIVITTICFILSLSLLATPRLFSQLTISGVIHNPFILIGPPLTLLWIIGLWNMKKWSVIGYTIDIIVTQLFALLNGQWTAFALLIFLLPLIALRYYSKMT